MKRTPIRRVSVKRAAANAELAEARAAVISRSGGACEGRTPACPSGLHDGEHAHHRLRRSQGGRHTVENLAWLCEAGHRHAHANPEWAYSVGLLVHSWDTPDA